MMKKLLSFLLIISMLLAIATPIVAANTLSFRDLINTSGKKHWAYDTIMKLAIAKVIGGMPDGTYKPEQSVTRAEFTKLVVEALQLEKTNRVSFDDIDNNWAKIYIETAVKEGVIIPSEVGKSFRPAEPITRKDVAYMVARGLKIEPYKVWDSFRYPYEDTNDQMINKLFFEYLLNGVVRENLRYFDEARSMSRAEAAVIIDRVMEYKKDKAAFKKVKREELVKTLVKAEPDAEFEKFINSPEARKYASVDYFKAENGILVFKEYGGWDFGDQIPQSTTIKDINKIAYNTVKELVKYARESNHYVSCWYSVAAGYPAIVINYYERSLNGDIKTENPNFRVSLMLVPYDIESQENISYWWDVTGLWRSDDMTLKSLEDLAKINYTQEAFTKPLLAMFQAVYGKNTGQKFYEYTLKEYRYEYTNPLEERRTNYSFGNIDGYRFQNQNGTGLQIQFSVTQKK